MTIDVEVYNPKHPIRVVTATSLFDGHDASITIMRRILQDAGIEVIEARIGYLAKDAKEFINHLSDLMDLAKESLEIKRKITEHFTEKGLYPYSKFYLRQVKKRFNKYWANHFSTIGLIGMNEACLSREDWTCTRLKTSWLQIAVKLR